MTVIARRMALASLVMAAGLAGLPVAAAQSERLYQAEPDGWVSFVPDDRPQAARVRVCLRLNAIAVSSDGQWLLAACESPHLAVLLDAQLKPVKQWEGRTLGGTVTSGFAAVVNAAARRSFVLTLRELPELWEISYDPTHEDVYEGLVHDYRMGEGIARRGFLHPKRTALIEALCRVSVDQQGMEATGTSSPRQGNPSTYVFNLDARRRVATRQALPDEACDERLR